MNDSIANGLKAAAVRLLKDPLLLSLLAALAAFTAIDPAKVSSYPSLVDWPTIAALAGLLILTKGWN